MDLEEGMLVQLVNPDTRSRFGEGPFKISSMLPHIHAVEIDEIGSLDISEVVPYEDGESLSDRLQPIPVSSATSAIAASPNEALARIETLAGALVGHFDTNVKLTAREILRLTWEATR